MPRSYIPCALFRKPSRPIDAHHFETTMISALQGRSSNLKLNPYAGLQYPMIISRCVHVRACINTLPLKDLHQFFPYLLSNIFGFDHSGGWGLCTFNRTLHSDFTQVLQFLSPGGDIFQLIAKLDADNFIYEFPIKCLPVPSQQALTEGIVPPFYANKVQLSYSVDNTPTHIFLSAFEYYFFHFAYFLVNGQGDQWSRLTPNMSDALYTNLLDTYLHYFLPFTGSIPEPFTSSQLQGSPHHYLGSTPPGSVGSSFHGPLSSSGSRRGFGMDSSGYDGTMPEDVEASQSEIFIQVLVEFWLNQYNYNGSQGDLVTEAQMPSGEQLMLVRCLLKQVHYFSNGFTYCSSSPTSSLLTSLMPVTDALRSSIVVVFFQKRLYRFLKYSFKHSPLDANFRYILELWLTFIQPWRYLDPNRESVENKHSLKTNQEKWKTFVWENFPFYSILLVEFLSRCYHLDLKSDNHVMLLYRTAKVFAQTGLMSFIEHGESLLLNQDAGPQTSPVSRGSPKAAVSSIKAILVNCDGPMFQYTPIFDQNVLQLVQTLQQKIHHAKMVLVQQLTPSVRQRGSSVQPPPSPSLSFSSSPTSFSPPKSSRAPAAYNKPQSQTKRSWLRSFGSWLVDLFSEDPVYSSRVSPTHQQSNPHKLVDLLEKTDQFLTTIFKLPDVSRSPGAGDGSPVLGRVVLTQATIGTDMDSPPPRSLRPDYIKGTTRLSPQGKMQVMQGLRKCSSLDIEYMGDPVLQPIRSFENATLVRALHHLSCGLNHRFAGQLMNIGTSKSIFSKLVLQLLAPPPPPPVLTSDRSLDLPPSTPTDHVTTVIAPTSSSSPSTYCSPRINLRPLASYYTLTYIFLFVLVAWFLSVPLWLDILLLLAFLFIFCCVSLLVYGTSPLETRKRK